MKTFMNIFGLAFVVLLISRLVSAEPFTVYDDIGWFRIHPEDRPTWIQSVRPLTEGALLTSDKQIDPVRIRNSAKLAATTSQITMLDIEAWAINPEGVAKYAEVIDIFRDEESGVRIGYYGIPPRDWWRALSSDPLKRQAWYDECKLALVVTNKADFVAPSLYTFYSSVDSNDIGGDWRKRWVAFAKANLLRASYCRKPVYAYLCPRYQLSGEEIERDFWRLQLETCRAQKASAVIIWTPYDMNPIGSEWWLETLNFFDR